MPDARAVLAQSLIIGFEGTTPNALLEELIARHGVGGVILFARNISSAQKVWELNNRLQQMAQKAGHPPLFIMVDQEGGSVARMRGPFTHQPDMCALGAADAEALYQHGFKMGRELVAAGFNWNLAPVMDVHGMKDGIMARRSLGSDPRAVGRLALAYSRGLIMAGCLACAKHFPGLGRTSMDTHKLGVKVGLSLDELKQVELVPFIMAIAAAVPGILISHATFAALDASLPASLSPKVIEGLLRGQLGYQGLVLTDDLEMGAVNLPPSRAAVAAYQAGNDLLLICRQTEEALPALDLLYKNYEDGLISDQRLQASYTRIQKAKEKLLPIPSLGSLKKLLAGTGTA